VIFVASPSFRAGWVSAWPREALIHCACAILAIPAWLSGLVFLTSWMEKALYDRSQFKVAVVAGGSSLFMLLLLAAVSWPGWPSWSAQWFVIAGGLLLPAPLFTYVLAQNSLSRSRYYEEWANLNIT
jgi:hypothetical protein